MIQVQFDGPEAPDEELLRNQITALASAFPNLEEKDAENIFEEVSAALSVRMDTGIAIEGRQHKPWLADRDPDWYLWKAYRELLAEDGRNPQVLATLDRDLNRILDHMGDPEDESPWSQRGLVIGEVQSGKTSTYIGLIDKAIDVGYRVIVLLGGSTELLRRQTQERVDFGVIGRDSSRDRLQANSSNVIGVGRKVTSTAHIDSLTTQVSDFRTAGRLAINVIPGPDKVVVLVTKKNKTVLTQIAKWFNDGPAGTSQLPLLLIDDESDFASINTNDPEQDPTAINTAIRGILGYFNRSSYLAFTATPFANIFIDDQIEQDLFPKDLIYALDSPTSYHGCRHFFEEVTPEGPVRHILDGEDYFPLGHKRTLNVDDLPESLIEALRCYLLTNAIRDLRGQVDRPTSMLINVSRFNDVQQRLHDLVSAELARYLNAIEMHSRTYRAGTPNPFLERLEGTFKAQFSECGNGWLEVLGALRRANHDVLSLIANARTSRPDVMPRRYVAIGGDLLSRGLTLEGLSTSYFYRRTQAADTLMQMGRWFGYRNGYEDLCRVWITEEMTFAFQHALAALDDLKIDVSEMARQQLTPRQFGISVRLHPDALAITARNKMKAGQKQQGHRVVSLRGSAIETTRLHGDPDVLRSNMEAAEAMVASFGSQGSTEVSSNGRVIWRDVDKSDVGSFLHHFEAQPAWNQQLFEGTTLADFVTGAVAEDLQQWDVVLMSGQGERTGEFTFPEFPEAWKPPLRKFGGSSPSGWTVSGKRMRLMGTGDAGLTLSPQDAESARAEFEASEEGKARRSVPDRCYIRKLKRPAMLLYPIRPRQPDAGNQPLPPDTPLLAVSTIFPGERQERDGANVTYVLNTAAQRLWVPELLEDLGDEDDHELR